ncbi:MAG: hypothetical protein HY904_17885 [Deltaproteobacteria bacterium]|nr:hypothetical protein [Deltaproteobacteria bacterium]
MLWSKKLEDCQAVLTKDLKPFLAKRLPDIKPEGVAEDLSRTAVRVDMSRSATRLRRRLYAQWGKWFIDGELYRLGPKGLEVRPDLLEKDPEEVGDLHIDPFRIISVARMLGVGGKNRLDNADRVRCVTLLLTSLTSVCRSRKEPLTERTVAVLMALHAVEANREVAREKVADAVKRHLTQWGYPVPDPAELQKELALLVDHGAIRSTGEGAPWRLGERLSYPW